MSDNNFYNLFKKSSEEERDFSPSAASWDKIDANLNQSGFQLKNMFFVLPWLLLPFFIFMNAYFLQDLRTNKEVTNSGNDHHHYHSPITSNKDTVYKVHTVYIYDTVYVHHEPRHIYVENGKNTASVCTDPAHQELRNQEALANYSNHKKTNTKVMYEKEEEKTTTGLVKKQNLGSSDLEMRSSEAVNINKNQLAINSNQAELSSTKQSADLTQNRTDENTGSLLTLDSKLNEEKLKESLVSANEKESVDKEITMNERGDPKLVPYDWTIYYLKSLVL